MLRRTLLSRCYEIPSVSVLAEGVQVGVGPGQTLGEFPDALMEARNTLIGQFRLVCAPVPRHDAIGLVNDETLVGQVDHILR